MFRPTCTKHRIGLPQYESTKFVCFLGFGQLLERSGLLAFDALAEQRLDEFGIWDGRGRVHQRVGYPDGLFRKEVNIARESRKGDRSSREELFQENVGEEGKEMKRTTWGIE